MSDEKKPFAEVTTGEFGGGRIIVAGLNMGQYEHWTTEGAANAVATINAAVEAREAGLVAEVREAVDHWAENYFVPKHQAAALQTALSKVLPATADYVPAAELKALKAKVEGQWQLLFDALAEGETSVETLVVLANAVGVPLTEKAKRLAPRGEAPLALPRSWGLSHQTCVRLSEEMGRPIVLVDAPTPFDLGTVAELTEQQWADAERRFPTVAGLRLLSARHESGE